MDKVNGIGDLIKKLKDYNFQLKLMTILSLLSMIFFSLLKISSP